MTTALSILSALGVSTVISTIFVTIFQRWLKKKDDRDLERAETMRQASEDRHMTSQKECIIIMKELQAIGHLSEATAVAVRDGKVNGIMTTALEYYTKAKDETNDYLLAVNAQSNH
jgi:hypothetical protein